MSDFRLHVQWDASLNRPNIIDERAPARATGDCYDDGVCTIAFVDSDRQPAPVLVQCEDWAAAGIVRLDEYPAGKANERVTGRCDLAIAADFITRRGIRSTEALIGDFAFVVWQPRTRTLIAVRDAFGVRRLYYAAGRDSVAVASNASLLADGTNFDLEYVAEFLTNGYGRRERTIYANVQPVSPGTVLVTKPRSVAVHTYWTPRLTGAFRGSAADAGNRFRQLLTTSVKLRLSPDGSTWARLSGGLDSSSIVCVASHDAENRGERLPFGGTITTVDSLGRGDEREFRQEVLARYGLPNTQVADYWLWQSDGTPPPRTDQPHLMYPFYARDRRGADVVRASGGRVMLCGMGADHYMDFLPVDAADSIARGSVVPAMRQLWEWSVAYRQSFWKTINRFAIRPLLPLGWRRLIASRKVRLPSWIDESFSHRLHLLDRLEAMRSATTPAGHRLQHLIEHQLGSLTTAGLAREVSGMGLDTRYPFLHRPLVEFALSLPPAMLMRPNAPKWILREALRGILPERIRTRSGKGTIGARILWSMKREETLLRTLTQDSVLQSLGCINDKALRRTVRRAQEGKQHPYLLMTLSLETWLRVRTGRWTDA